MLLETIIVGSGYYAQFGNKPVVVMFLVHVGLTMMPELVWLKP